MQNIKKVFSGIWGLTALTIVGTGVGTAIDPEAAFSFSITASNNGNELLDAILGDTTGLSDFEIAVSGNPMAVGLFQDDPFSLGSGIVLSTGEVEAISGINTLDGTTRDGNGRPQSDLSTNFNGRCLPSVNAFLCESTTIEIGFDVADGIEKIFFNYVFGSEEFLEFGGNGFNDSFELLLNGENLARLSDGQTVSINNLARNSQFHRDYIDNPVGSQTPTKLDGFTQVLGFEGLLNANERNTLSIKITDVGDNSFDSAVFIQGKTLGTNPPTQSVREPSLWLGYLWLGAVAYRYQRQKSK
ncbi:MAG: choice-of-anchor L domain-containing protein [Cyanobacteriota bacterium]|nr:choice-of-anchor L domain-containing protein [Cyanobacteriota bacterium]